MAVLRGGAAALATVLVAAEIHHWATGGALGENSRSFLEAALHVDALGLLAVATLRVNRGLDAPVLRTAWQTQGALALAGAVVLLLFNPAFTDAEIGRLPLLDDLFAAYALPAALAFAALRLPELDRTAAPPALRLYALVAGFAWISLEVRHLFHGDRSASIPSRSRRRSYGPIPAPGSPMARRCWRPASGSAPAACASRPWA